MKRSKLLSRKTHFLGSKIRGLRKRNGLTLDDLSIRCMQIDQDNAPSVSYLSLIESGKRIPSSNVLKIFCKIFQKEMDWFLDDKVEMKNVDLSGEGNPLHSVQLEPNFLFSKKLLETSIPELLSQTGVSGRKFAHILIRSYQEQNKNQFPDLERAADEIGMKKFPVNENDLILMAKKIGLKIKWFDQKSFVTNTESNRQIKSLFRSFFYSPDQLYINTQLRDQPARLKYDLATHIAHKVLHNGDGIVSSQATGGELGGSPRPDYQSAESISAQEILLAWRDFECSFFAGALLCPKQPFRQYLNRYHYDVFCGKHIGLTPAVVMRRMTAVSTYPYWHYFDAYPPGYLRAVYRGNGIPLPWGNMNVGIDPCRQWAVFRMLDEIGMRKPIAQLSLLNDGELKRLYSCISIRTRDGAGNPHVITAGIDLVPALSHQEIPIEKMLNELSGVCKNAQDYSLVDSELGKQIMAVSRILNIKWIGEGLENPIKMICPRSSNCPKEKPCEYKQILPKKVSWVNEIREKILSEG